MKRDYFLTFLLCGGLLLSMLTGCKSSKKVGTVESASVKAHNEFFQSVEDQSFQFRTLTARLNVDLASGARSSLGGYGDTAIVPGNRR